MIIEGDFATGVTFKHADGSSYGAISNPEAASTKSDAFSALKNLGFKHTESQRAIDAAAAQVWMKWAARL